MQKGWGARAAPPAAVGSAVAGSAVAATAAARAAPAAARAAAATAAGRGRRRRRRRGRRPGRWRRRRRARRRGRRRRRRRARRRRRRRRRGRGRRRRRIRRRRRRWRCRRRAGRRRRRRRERRRARLRRRGRRRRRRRRRRRPPAPPPAAAARRSASRHLARQRALEADEGHLELVVGERGDGHGGGREELESAGSERDEASERACRRRAVRGLRESAEKLRARMHESAAADRCEGVNEASEASDRTDGGAAECAEGGVGGAARRDDIFCCTAQRWSARLKRRDPTRRHERQHAVAMALVQNSTMQRSAMQASRRTTSVSVNEFVAAFSASAASSPAAGSARAPVPAVLRPYTEMLGESGVDPPRVDAHRAASLESTNNPVPARSGRARAAPATREPRDLTPPLRARVADAFAGKASEDRPTAGAHQDASSRRCGRCATRTYSRSARRRRGARGGKRSTPKAVLEQADRVERWRLDNANAQPPADDPHATAVDRMWEKAHLSGAAHPRDTVPPRAAPHEESPRASGGRDRSGQPRASATARARSRPRRCRLSVDERRSAVIDCERADAPFFMQATTRRRPPASGALDPAPAACGRSTRCTGRRRKTIGMIHVVRSSSRASDCSSHLRTAK